MQRHPRPSLARAIVLSSVAVAALLSSACGRSDRAPAGGARVASAPLTGDATCGGTTVHEKHVAQFACGTCHPSGATWGFTNPYTFPSGRTTTAGGTIVLASGAAPTSCSIGCHYPMGAAAHTVAWTDPAPLACTACHDVNRLPAAHPAVTAAASRADCQVCHLMDAHMQGAVKLVGHPAAWMVQTDPGFHAFSANQGLAVCQTCHLPDLSGGATGFACGQCHDVKDASGAVVKAWPVNCVMCHGGGDNATGAPPAATWGHGDPSRGGGAVDAVRVGAHTSHLGSAIAPAMDCAVCHVKPADALAAGHIDGPTATVTFGGLATVGVAATPIWDRTSATCWSTYCHGATLAGGTLTTPVWTSVGMGQGACGTCHGLPPPSPHPVVDATSGLGVCAACHPATVDALGAIIPPSAGGKHLDGLVEATGGHSASWMVTTDPGFHAFSANEGIASCKGCHGADLSGGSAGVACARCHTSAASGGTANDFASCTACHGGTNDQTAAPPKATWGHAGDPSRGGGTLDPVRVGAHAKHVSTTALATSFDCTVCHVKPTSILSAGHLDAPTATLTFGGVASSSGAAPSWTRSSATCSSTYCHGGYSGTFTYQTYDWGIQDYVNVTVSYSGGNGTPAWTDGAMTCTSCHGNPPAGAGSEWHSGHHGNVAQGMNECQLCHPDASSTDGVGTTITDPTLHVNGVVDVTPQWKTTCFGCH
jgi:predicted CxxxxCH...CXXCH cytochrome family protein